MSKSIKNNVFFKTLFILIVIVILFIVSVAIIFSNTYLREKILNNFKIHNEIIVEQNINNDSDVDTNSTDSSKLSQKPQTLLKQTKRADMNYFEDILFIGDSRTVGLVKMGFINEENVLAEVGLSHKDALNTRFKQKKGSYTIQKYISITSPRVISIGFGINGLSYMSKDDFMAKYNNLIDTVKRTSPNSKIVVQSILPVGKTKEIEDDRYNNDKIQQYNNLIYNMCEEKGVYYMNLYDCLIDHNTGYLNEDYDSGDGLHFNKAAYEQITEYMLTHTI